MLESLLRPRHYSWKHTDRSLQPCSPSCRGFLPKTKSPSAGAGLQAANCRQQRPRAAVWLTHWSSRPPELLLQYKPNYLFAAIEKYLNYTRFESTLGTKTVALGLSQHGLRNVEPSKEWVCFATGWVSCSYHCPVTQAWEKGGNMQAKEEGRVNFLVAPCTWIDLQLLRNHHPRNDFSRSVLKIWPWSRAM